MKSHTAILLGLAMMMASSAFLVAPARALVAGTSAGAGPQNGSSAEPANIASYVSPITGISYAIRYDAARQDNVYTAGGRTYSGVEELLNYETSLFPDSTYKLEPSLRGATADDQPDGRLSVVIFLTPQFGHDTAQNFSSSYLGSLQTLWNARQRVLDRIMSTNILGPLPPEGGSISSALESEFEATDARYSGAVQRMRSDTFATTELLNAPSQDSIAKKIEGLGGDVFYKGAFVNVIAARISPAGLAELVKDPLVSLVYRDQVMNALLNISVPSISASTWWNAGYNTATYKLVVADTGVNQTHPALAGKITDNMVFHADAQTQADYADDPNNVSDLQGHGTHVAGIVTSTDSTYRGVAYGLKGVVNAKFGYLTTSGGGRGTWPDAMAALDWAIGTAGASVASLSFGSSTNGNGNGGMERFMDAIVDDLGIPFSAAAGNDGPGAGTLGEPADAFNIISVGAMDDHGTTTRSDDDIAFFSSRGPTTDGRIKPDIAAPGADSARGSWGIRSCYYQWTVSNLWVDYPGTSMAAPHVGGSLILLLNYLGPRGFFPAIPKALLLENAQDKGTAGPDNNYGWGYIDLSLAYQNRDKVYNDTVNTSQAKFYVGSWAANDKATLVWQKHVVYRGASFPSVYYPLNNLDLSLYNGQTNARTAQSASLVDDVEQVAYGSAITTPVIKVKALPPLRGVTQESYALATLQPFTLARPPTYQTTWDGPASVEVGNVFSITANVTNVGDLTAFTVSGGLTPTPGLTLIAGANPVALGNINPGAVKSATWTFRADSVGNKTVSLALSSYSYEEWMNGTSAFSLRVVDSIPPKVNRTWAFPSPQNAGLTVNISADMWDNLAIFSARANVTGPRGFTGNFTMTRDPVSGYWFIERPYFIAGNYDVVAWASDMDHWGWNVTNFSIIDSTPPAMLSYDAQPNPQQIHGRVNITATIQDQAGVQSAWAEVTDPSSTTTNATMQRSGDSFWLENQYDILGTYGYRISAIDPSWNWKVATGTFAIVDTIPPAIMSLSAQPNPQEVFGRVNITSTISDVGGVVNAYVAITDPQGGVTNTTLQRSGNSYWLNQTYGLLGVYSYGISAVDIVGRWAVGTGNFRIVDTISPIAEAGPDQVVEWAKTVTFDGSGSSDNFGIASYTWTFNDNGTRTLNGVIANYVFMRPGRYVVTLTIVDFAGNRGTDTMTVTVQDLTRPEIANVLATPDPQNLDGTVTISAKITDNVAVADAWVEIEDPNFGLSNQSLPNVGGDTFALSQDYGILGLYHFTIKARDAANNWNSTSGTFSIRDLTAPVIISVSAAPTPVEVHNPVTITADITDNVGITAAYVEIYLPDGSLDAKYLMSYDASLGMFTKNYGTKALGLHTYNVTTSDLAGNQNNASGQFLVRDTVNPTVTPTNYLANVEVDTPLNFTATATDNFGVTEVFAEVTNPGGGNDGNITMAPDQGAFGRYYAEFNFHALGDYKIALSVRDLAGNWGVAQATVKVADTHPPHADAGPDQTVTVGETVTFDGSRSTDTHGIASYTWTFVDRGASKALSGVNPKYNFTESGTYQVTLTVADSGGNTDSDTMFVTVEAKESTSLLTELISLLPILLVMAIILIAVGLALRYRSDKKEREEKRKVEMNRRKMAQRRAQEATAQTAQHEPAPTLASPPPPPSEEASPPRRPPPPPPPPEDL